jgi:2-methylisocitrate lyase-like PEP mutase family enzyme
MKNTSRLRSYLDRDNASVVPCCFDALTAKVLDEAGFETIGITGSGVSLFLLGMPDSGFATMTEVVTTATHICEAVHVPVIADADTGYGNALNVRRAVKEFARAGVAGVHIEDQVAPKRCGHIAGKMIIPAEEMVGKIRAATEAREDDDFIIIARTDARGAVGGGVAEAIKRANVYYKAGADAILIDGINSVRELELYPKKIKAPLDVGVTGLTPRLSIEELEQFGWRLVTFPGLLARACAKATWDWANKLKRLGTQALIDLEGDLKGHPVGDFYGFAGFHDVRQLEEKYLPKKLVKQRYKKTVGYEP